MRLLSPLIFIFSFYLVSCSGKPSVPNNVVLARVGPSIITIQDFIRRSEYTIRPDFCRQDNYIHKKIILNSLISEKLTSLEYKKSFKEVDANFEPYLKGRKEQAMRQVHFAEKFYSKVDISEMEVRKLFKLAGRRVQVQYLNLPDSSIVDKIKKLDSQNIPLDSIYNVLWQGQAPTKEISWFDREVEDIRNAIFSEDIIKGSLLGPFETEDNTFMIIKIKGWTNKIAITESDKELLWNDIQEKLTETKAKKRYMSWVEDLMSGKKMELNSNIFYNYAEKVADHYFKADSLKKNMLGQVLWDDQEFKEEVFSTNDYKIDKKDVILNYDGIPWTVQELNDQLKSHPFVFRKRKMKRSEFPEQLRFAIADLIRDAEITKQCYLEGYDKKWNVYLNEEMWRDVSKSKKYASKLRSQNENITSESQWIDFMNPRIDSLQTLYSDQIEINMSAFEKIKLTTTDMMVIQRGVPYPILVPSFPILTSDHKLDYGKKIN
ncbi:MAG: hypothetical protein ACJZ10_03115 [Candidatus Neomarinimicrobiota bacterium]